MAKTITPIALLIDFLEQAYDKKAWHGTTLRGSLRNIDYREALWRPSPKHHNIWETILHTAYWKYIVRRKLISDIEASFPRQGSDWPKLPESPDIKTWKDDIALLKKQHNLLLKALKTFPASKLETYPPESKIQYKRYILGIGSHDLYHAGQIQLLKRLQRGGVVKKKR